MRNQLLIFIFVLLFNGCRKKDPDAISAVYLFPQEVKDYCLFLPGTYWIYKDSITGIEDCVYVINQNSGIDTIEINTDNEGKEVVEYFGYETKSIIDNSVNFFSSNTSFYKCVEENRSEPCFWLNREKYFPGNYVGGGFCFLFKFYEGFWGYSGFATGYSKITIIKHWPSITLSNILYYDVVEFYDDKNITENDNKTNFFFAKNVGIIRKELLDNNQTWNLIRCKIIQ